MALDPRRRRRLLRAGAALIALALLLPLLAVVVSSARGAVSDPAGAISILKEGEEPSNAEIAVRLSEATPGAAETVVIGRDDIFADSLASAVLQQDGPLLLVPSQGPVPTRVREEIRRLGASQAVVLGGETAVSPAVVEELQDLNLAVERRAGASRLETAAAVAQMDAQNATTALLVRGFPAAGGSDSQAFADTLGAGALAAANGWPILLTQTEVLSGTTRAHLQASAITEVLIVGGTAAISDAVQDEVEQLGIATERIAGPDRFATGVAVAARGGASSAADVARVVLVAGEGDNAWAGGFAASRHAALTGAAVVLARNPANAPVQAPGVAGAEPLALPAATESFLTGDGGLAGATPPVELTCVALPGACEQARRSLGYRPSATVAFDPPDISPLTSGEVVAVEVAGAEGAGVEVSGTCLAAGSLATADTTLSVTAAQVLPPEACTIVVTVDLGDGQTQVATATYPQPGSGDLRLVSASPDGTNAGGMTPRVSGDGSTVVFVSDGVLVDAVQDDLTHVYAWRDGQVALVDRRADGSAARADASHSLIAPPAISDDGSTVAFASLDGALDPTDPGDPSGRTVYVTQVGSTPRLVSRDVEGSRAVVSGGIGPALAGDGRTVAFVAQGVGEPGGGVAGFKLFVHELDTGETTAVRDPAGGLLSGVAARDMHLSRDGRALTVLMNGPVAGVSDTTDTVLLSFDLASGDVERLDVAATGEPLVTSQFHNHLGVSGDAQRVAFASDASNAVGADPGNAQPAVFLRDRGANRTTVVARAVDGAPANARRPSMSPSGAFAVFWSGTGVNAPGTSLGCGVYRADVRARTIRRIDVGADGSVSQSVCSTVVDVANTGAVVFDSSASLVAGDTGMVDVYIGY